MQRTYFAVIGERLLRLEARNVWEAAHQAGLWFGSHVREGTDFMEGRVRMALYRPGSGEPIFAGTVDLWRRVFHAQGRRCRWPEKKK